MHIHLHVIYVYGVYYYVYNTQMNSKEFFKLLERDGWIVRNSKGSHHVFKHPVKTSHITVPHQKGSRRWFSSKATKTSRN